MTSIVYSVPDVPAGFGAEKTYYPTDIGTMGELPLVSISHGNGHNYQWYDYLGNHLASYGFVVMSHANDTMPGIDAIIIDGEGRLRYSEDLLQVEPER